MNLKESCDTNQEADRRVLQGCKQVTLLLPLLFDWTRTNMQLPSLFTASRLINDVQCTGDGKHAQHILVVVK